jgi:hypothetical protein
MCPHDWRFSASLALIQMECDQIGVGRIWTTIQIAGMAAASLKCRVTCAPSCTSAARAEIPTAASAALTKAVKKYCAATPSRITKAGMVAIETISKIKAIDKGCPILQTMILTIHDKARLATREIARVAKRSSSVAFAES